MKITLQTWFGAPRERDSSSKVKYTPNVAVYFVDPFFCISHSFSLLSAKQCTKKSNCCIQDLWETNISVELFNRPDERQGSIAVKSWPSPWTLIHYCRVVLGCCTWCCSLFHVRHLGIGFQSPFGDAVFTERGPQTSCLGYGNPTRIYPKSVTCEQLNAAKISRWINSFMRDWMWWWKMKMKMTDCSWW